MHSSSPTQPPGGLGRVPGGRAASLSRSPSEPRASPCGVVAACQSWQAAPSSAAPSVPEPPLCGRDGADCTRSDATGAWRELPTSADSGMAGTAEVLIALTFLGAHTAHAALFDDDEARKRIAATNTRLDQLQKDLDTRLSALEQQAKNQGLDLLRDLEARQGRRREDPRPDRGADVRAGRSAEAPARPLRRPRLAAAQARRRPTAAPGATDQPAPGAPPPATIANAPAAGAPAAPAAPRRKPARPRRSPARRARDGQRAARLRRRARPVQARRLHRARSPASSRS